MTAGLQFDGHFIPRLFASTNDADGVRLINSSRETLLAVS